MLPAVEAEALLVIGTLESDLTWNAVDYSTIIKVGIAGWLGGQAAQLLDSLDAVDKVNLTQTLTDDLTTYSASDPFWATRFLTKDEGNSIITALGTATAETTERSFFSSTISGYEAVLSTWGCDAGNTSTIAQQKAFIFLASVYHVNLRVAASICSAIGGQASTQNIYDAIMNKPEIATLRNWSVAKTMLDAWEGVAPSISGGTDPVWTDPGGTGDGGTAIPQVESQIQRIGMTGQQLIVYGEDNEAGVVCYRQTNNLWIPTSNTAAPPTPTPIVPPEPEGPPATTSDFDAMRQLWYDHEEDWSYGWGAGRLNPESSGYTDCSGCIWWAVNKIRPDLAEGLGTFTTPQSHAGTLVVEGTLSSSTTVDPSILKEGDIVLVSKSGGYLASGDSHVEWYFGNDTLWGAGYAPLPHFSSSSVSGYLQAVSSKYRTFMIRRFLS